MINSNSKYHIFPIFSKTISEIEPNKEENKMIIDSQMIFIETIIQYSVSWADKISAKKNKLEPKVGL